MMDVRLPDMTGPPVWWDVGVLALAGVGLVAVVRRALRPTYPKPLTVRVPRAALQQVRLVRHG